MKSKAWAVFWDVVVVVVLVSALVYWAVHRHGEWFGLETQTITKGRTWTNSVDEVTVGEVYLDADAFRAKALEVEVAERRRRLEELRRDLVELGVFEK